MMECAIIKDLLPSFIDGLTSKESNRAVGEHLKECAKCRDYLEEMKAELESGKYMEINKEQEKAEIWIFKKLKKIMERTVFGTIVAVLLVMVVLWGIYEQTFIFRISTLSDEVEVTYENVKGVVRVGFEPKKDNVRIEGWMGVLYDESSGKLLTNASGRERDCLTLVSCGISPLKKDGNKNFYLHYVFLDDGTVIYLSEYGENIRAEEDDILTVEFGDKTVEIPLRDLRTEAGIEKLK